MREFKKFDDPNDPAMAPVYEAGGGESEGFEMAEDALIEHASHGDEHGTTKILNDAGELGDEAERTPEDDDGVFGDADSEQPDDLGRG
jgi:hypothetical protein